MAARVVVGLAVMTFFVLHPAKGGAREDLQRHLNGIAVSVKSTDDAASKRQILENELQTLSTAVDLVESSGMVSDEERSGLSRYGDLIRDKQDELMGRNGYERVPDMRLDAFSTYMVQDLEQGDTTVTISVITLLLIIIIVILLAQ